MPGDNAYCNALGIEPPCLEDLAPAREPSLFHWMVLALLEHGAPMPIEAIAARLEELAVEANTGDLPYSLRKAWHGLKPVYQDATGLCGLDLQDWHVRVIARAAGLFPERVPAPEPTLERAADTEPITVEEMEALLAEGISSPSMLRVTAGVLEASGGPMTIDEVNAWVQARLKYGRFQLTPQTIRGWRSPLVGMDTEGALSLNPSAADLPASRRQLRDVTHPRLLRKAQAAATAVRVAAAAIERQAESRRLALGAVGRRHALVHVVPDPREPSATVILDMEARTFAVFIGEVPAGALDAFDAIIGVDIRITVPSLGIALDRPRAHPWFVVDLAPPQKTLKLNKQGRKLDITTELLLRGTTGLSLGEPDRIAGYLQTGDHRRLAARLEADAKALHAYYTYGRLHGYVRLRWGFLDETLGVEWALPGEPGIREILAEAHAEGREVDIVVGSAPGWSDPWSRAHPARVVKSGYSYAIEMDGREVSLDNVQAVRTRG